MMTCSPCARRICPDCNPADERRENAPAPAVETQHGMEVDEDGDEGSQMDDEEVHKTELLGLVQELARRRMPNTITFILRR